MVHVITSTSAAARLGAARAFVGDQFSPARGRAAAEIVIAGASRGAADDFARAIARGAAATFGLTRFSFMELAARAAEAHLAARSAASGVTATRVPGTHAGAEAM